MFNYSKFNNRQFSNVGDGNGLTTDLFADSFVDFRDYAIRASGWQADYNVYDLNKMADEWLKNGNPPIAVTISGDVNDFCFCFSRQIPYFSFTVRRNDKGVGKQRYGPDKDLSRRR